MAAESPKKQSQFKPNSNPIKANLLDAQMNVSSVLTKYYENERLRRRGENKPKTNPKQSQFQTRSEFTPKGAEIPTGELLGILKPGTNFKPSACTDTNGLQKNTTANSPF